MNLCQFAVLFLGLISAGAADISPPTLTNGQFSFTFESDSERVFTVEESASASAGWSDLSSRRGDGKTMSFTVAPTNSPRFFRLRATPFRILDLEPSTPTLPNGNVSLRDALAGSPYLQTISPALKGIPPYAISASGTPPDGISIVIASNNTANARIAILSEGLGLFAGQRRQFTLYVTDSAGTTASRTYDLRVIRPAPQLLTTLVTHKAGKSPVAVLTATNGFGSLTFEIISGTRPTANLTLAGFFQGAPSPEDAELNGDGRFTNQVRVTDSLTDRVTGLPTPRSTTNTLVQVVKLSFEQNLWNETSNGPRFLNNCAGCHQASFPPNLPALGPAIIGVRTAPESTFCSDGQNYITPGSPETSLIYKKITNPDCGNRMPLGGPYLNEVPIRLVERWIRELEPGETD